MQQIAEDEKQMKQLLKIKLQIEDEKDLALRKELIAMYEQPLMKFGISVSQLNGSANNVEAFFENTDDIINEEEFEESVIN